MQHLKFNTNRYAVLPVRKKIIFDLLCPINMKSLLPWNPFNWRYQKLYSQSLIKKYVHHLGINHFFTAPEIQHKSVCSLASDMFSLGMLMIATFNGGQSLIQANHSTNLYFKQAGVVSNLSIIQMWARLKNLFVSEPYGLRQLPIFSNQKLKVI